MRCGAGREISFPSWTTNPDIIVKIIATGLAFDAAVVGSLVMPALVAIHGELELVDAGRSCWAIPPAAARPLPAACWVRSLRSVTLGRRTQLQNDFAARPLAAPYGGARQHAQPMTPGAA
jgi:hypothetical protein